eukprot:SAG25_NODE_2053_length_1996_cov_6.212888_1_plen_60_part_00
MCRLYCCDCDDTAIAAACMHAWHLQEGGLACHALHVAPISHKDTRLTSYDGSKGNQSRL